MSNPRNSVIAFAVLLSSLVLGIPVEAQGESPQRTVLIPIHVSSLEGAHASLWKTVLSAHNTAPDSELDEVFIPVAISPCRVPCGDFFLPGGRTAYLQLMPGHLSPESYAWLVDLYGQSADQVSFNLRAWDVSQSHQEQGIELPIVDLSEAPDDLIVFLDIAAPSELFRSNLRIYNLSRPMTSATVRIRFWKISVRDESASSVDRDIFLGESIVDLPQGTNLEDRMIHPGYVSMQLDQTGLDWDDAERLRVEIISEEEVPFYAFITTTNNVTNAVTVHTPEQVASNP